ncbi:potassium voltage-gated channel subfamily F member 1-like [Saccostrea cucullata]|uniref:potassium voltage-gated channel subfamily F member 1-like n=1 Tax=Saccostrea cuccullata TaxID=36930 RepID=UPI002ED039FA
MEELIVKVGEEEFGFNAISLEKIPDSYLKRLVLEENKCKTMSFPRCRESFRAIHEFYFSGKLHIPKSVCVGKFKEELEFWGIDESAMEECCLRKLYDYDLQQKSLLKFKCDFSRRQKKCEDRDNNNISTKSLRQKVWEILDYQNDSIYAKVYLFLSTLVVLASCIMIAVSTLPEIRSKLIMETENKNTTNLEIQNQNQNSLSSNVYCKETILELNKTKTNVENCRMEFCILCDEFEILGFPISNSSQRNIIMNICKGCLYADATFKTAWIKKDTTLSTTAKNSIQLFLFEIIIMTLFTFEFLLRLTCCPNLKLYFFSILNIMDAVTLTANYVRYGIFFFEINIAESKFEFLLYFQTFRILRLLRSLNSLEKKDQATY